MTASTQQLNDLHWLRQLVRYWVESSVDCRIASRSADASAAGIWMMSESAAGELAMLCVPFAHDKRLMKLN